MSQQQFLLYLLKQKQNTGHNIRNAVYKKKIKAFDLATFRLYNIMKSVHTTLMCCMYHLYMH